jgi:hypothetical protein
MSISIWQASLNEGQTTDPDGRTALRKKANVKFQAFKASLAVTLPLFLTLAGCASDPSVPGSSTAPETRATENDSSSVRDNAFLIKSFDYTLGETPENIVVTDLSTEQFAATLLNNTLWWSTGRTEQIVPGESDAMTLGIAEDAEHRLYVAVRSQDPAVAGIWRRSVEEMWERYVPVQTTVGLNGITFGDDGTLYAADSVNGRILALQPGGSSFAVWLDDPALKPTSSEDPVGASGVNGLKVFGSYLYASNTAQGTLLRIPIWDDPRPIPEQVLSGRAVDDFALDKDGAIYLAVHPDNTVVRVDPAGQQTVLGTAEDGLDGPTAIAIAQSGVITTNLGFLGTRHHPSIIFITAPVSEPTLPKPAITK